MKRFHAALGVLLLALGLTVTVGSAVQAAPKDPYQRWLDEPAVIVSMDGVLTTYTERQVGSPAYQQQMQTRLSGGVSPLTVYWNCPGGVGCFWRDINGGGWTEIVSVGGYGTNNCYSSLSSTHNDNASSASADYGNGWDLKLWDWTGCQGATWLAVLTSHSVNFTGPVSYFNDITSAFMVTQAG